MKTRELDALIDDCTEGCLSEADAARLNAMLQESPAARARYWETASVHGLLENSLQQASLRVVTGEAGRESERVLRWLQWRPLAAAAAGLVFGILSASMVWAYAIPSAGRMVDRTVTVLAEGFEDSTLVPGRGFPAVANRWSGNTSAPTEVESEVKPSEGNRMVRLTKPPQQKFGYVWRLVDLKEHPLVETGGPLHLAVAAKFSTAGAARSAHYQIRLAAFSEAPTEVRAIWNNEPLLFNTVLQHVSRNMLTKPGEAGWQTVQAAIEIPPGTRSVVIALAAGEADAANSPAQHYLDDVQARLVFSQAPAE